MFCSTSFVWTSCSCMLEQRKTTCWLNNVVQTWYNILFKHDEVTSLNNHVTTLVNMVVLLLMFSPVPTAMNSYCWFIIAEQCRSNNSEQHCWQKYKYCWANSVATGCAIFGCVNDVKIKKTTLFYWTRLFIPNKICILTISFKARVMVKPFTAFISPLLLEIATTAANFMFCMS